MADNWRTFGLPRGMSLWELREYLWELRQLGRTNVLRSDEEWRQMYQRRQEICAIFHVQFPEDVLEDYAWALEPFKCIF